MGRLDDFFFQASQAAKDRLVIGKLVKGRKHFGVTSFRPGVSILHDAFQRLRGNESLAVHSRFEKPAELKLALTAHKDTTRRVEGFIPG